MTRREALIRVRDILVNVPWTAFEKGCHYFDEEDESKPLNALGHVFAQMPEAWVEAHRLLDLDISQPNEVYIAQALGLTVSDVEIIQMANDVDNITRRKELILVVLFTLIHGAT